MKIIQLTIDIVVDDDVNCEDDENNEEAVAELFDSLNDILQEQLPEAKIKIIKVGHFSPVDETAEPDRFWADGE